MNGSNYVQHPEEVIQMFLEIQQNHPKLWYIVKEKPDINEALAEIGAYLGLEMDGSYDIRKTCDDFWKLLRQRSSIIILPRISVY